MVNQLKSGSQVVVEVPAEISLTGGSCLVVDVGSTCAINNGTHLTATLSTVLAAATNVTIRVSSVTNPATTTTTGSLLITTYYEDTQSVVDELKTGVTVTATSVPLQSVTLTSDSSLVRAIANYTLEVQVANALPATSTLKVQIPTASFSVRDITLAEFKIAGTVVPCTMTTLADLYYEFPCFSSEVSAASIISIKFSNVSNPTSTKPT